MRSCTSSRVTQALVMSLDGRMVLLRLLPIPLTWKAAASVPNIVAVLTHGCNNFPLWGLPRIGIRESHTYLSVAYTDNKETVGESERISLPLCLESCWKSSGLAKSPKAVLGRLAPVPFCLIEFLYEPLAKAGLGVSFQHYCITFWALGTREPWLTHQCGLIYQYFPLDLL